MPRDRGAGRLFYERPHPLFSTLGHEVGRQTARKNVDWTPLNSADPVACTTLVDPRARPFQNAEAVCNRIRKKPGHPTPRPYVGSIRLLVPYIWRVVAGVPTVFDRGQKSDVTRPESRGVGGSGGDFLRPLTDGHLGENDGQQETVPAR